MPGVSITQDLYRQYEKHLALGATSSADSLAEQMHRRHPTDELAVVAAARSVLRRGAVGDAARLLEQLGSPRSHSLAASWLAVVRVRQGRLEDAMTLAQQAARGSTPVPEAWRVLGDAALAAHRPAETVTWMSRLLAIQADDVGAWKLLARAFRAQRKHLPAAQALAHVVARAPADAEAWCMAVRTHAELGNMDDARDHVMRALAVHPRHPELLQLANQVRAQATTSNSRVRSVIDGVRQAIAAQRLTDAEKALAELFATMRATRAMKFVRAELDAASPGANIPEHLRAAGKLARDYPEAWEPRALLADLYLRPSPMKNVRQALTHADEAWTMSGGAPRAGLLLMMACLRDNRAAHAEALGNQLKALGPHVAEQAERLLRAR